MIVWDNYSELQREEYIKFLQIYGALSNLFLQKKGNVIPYLDSKYQETIFAKIFNCKNVDIGNTPHDVLSVFGKTRIGIGLKTWMGSNPSFQKVMQIKSYKDEIHEDLEDVEALAYNISVIKNNKMKSDYERLGLTENLNIYHYITRDKGKFTVNESAYPLVDINKLTNVNKTSTSLSWSDGRKEYKYTFGDSQIWQKFESTRNDTFTLRQFEIKIIDDPFSFLLESFSKINDSDIVVEEFEEVFLPLYSFSSDEVEEKSGLNAWNAAPKNKNNENPRPLNEVYIPIPIDFHKKVPNFFTENIFRVIEQRKNKNERDEKKNEVRFKLQLPNGKIIPALVTGDNMKHFQSGSNSERDENGKLYGQSALGQWLLCDVLGLRDRVLVTREWLKKRDTDSVRLWRKKNDYTLIYIDFAPIGSFNSFIKDDFLIQE